MKAYAKPKVTDLGIVRGWGFTPGPGWGRSGCGMCKLTYFG